MKALFELNCLETFNRIAAAIFNVMMDHSAADHGLITV
jgi:hypothetical protein